jgi:hypothetical protein
MSTYRSRRLATPVALAAIVSAAAMAQPAAAVLHDRDCSDFRTHRQAQHFFETHNPRRDPHNLDGDNDGIACEVLP